MKCKDIMTDNIRPCHLDCTVKQTVELMKGLDCGVMPIVDRDNVLKGIVTDRDIAFYIVLNDKDPESTTIGEFMSKDIITCQPDDDVDSAIHKMSKYQVRRIPVVDENNQLVGIISLGDVAIKSGEEHETYEALEHISEPKVML